MLNRCTSVDVFKASTHMYCFVTKCKNVKSLRQVWILSYNFQKPVKFSYLEVTVKKGDMFSIAKINMFWAECAHNLKTKAS